MALFRRTRRSAGFDLGGSSIKIAVAETSRGGRTIRQLVLLPLKEEIIVEGMIFDPAEMSGAIRRAQVLADLGSATISTAARCGREAMIKLVDLPRASRDRARRDLPTDKTVGFPIAADEGVFDVVILEPDSDSPIMRAVAVAARKEPIRQRQKVFADAQLPVALVDLDAFALYNVFRECMPDFHSERAMLVNIGYETAIFAVVKEGNLVAARQTLSSGTRPLLEQVSASRAHHNDVDPEDLLMSDDLLSIHGDIVEEWVENIAMDIRQAIDSRMDPNEEVGTIFLTGGGALVTGFRDMLAREMETSVQVLNPLEHLDIADEVRANHLQEGPRFAIALGLALRDDQ